ncbi:MAG: redoxin domain-containing protein [Xanthomonadales bacterium]|nr:redoxin domain-containing protein [Xanthomonadales bacterium]
MMQTNNRLRSAALFLALTCFSFQLLAVQPGEPAPTLVLTQMGDGREISLSNLKGKIVYVDFWASWCGPCRQSLPLYQALYKRLSNERFEILAVNLDEDRKDAEKFLKRHPVSYPVLLDPSGNSAKTWSVLVMPSSYLVDSNGKLAYIYRGFETSHIGDIEDDIKKLLGDLPGH